MAHESNNKESKLSSVVGVSERLVYYGVSTILTIAILMVFVSAVMSMLQVLEVGVLQTALAILDQVLLIFIFAELLNTIGIVAQEHEIVAEPFLLVGLIAIVRRILLITAELERGATTEAFQNTLIELGVLTALVIVLSSALYLIRRT